MKALLLFLVIFSGVFYLFGSEEIERVNTLSAIERAPGFVPATSDGISGVSGKKGTQYRVRYKYQVNGISYVVSTSPTDEAGAQAYLAQKVDVAYDTRNPSVATLKRYYDLRRPNETVAQALIVSAVLSLGISLPIAIGISWPLGWLRRRKKQ